MVREATRRVDRVAAGDLLFQHGPPFLKWQHAQVPPTLMQTVEDHVDGRGAVHARVIPAQQVDLANELIIEDTYLASRISWGATRPAMAAVISGKQPPWSTPVRLIRRTLSPSLYATILQPSYFSSYTQPGRWKVLGQLELRGPVVRNAHCVYSPLWPA